MLTVLGVVTAILVDMPLQIGLKIRNAVKVQTISKVISVTAMIAGILIGTMAVASVATTAVAAVAALAIASLMKGLFTQDLAQAKTMLEKRGSMDKQVKQAIKADAKKEATRETFPGLTVKVSEKAADQTITAVAKLTDRSHGTVEVTVPASENTNLPVKAVEEALNYAFAQQSKKDKLAFFGDNEEVKVTVVATGTLDVVAEVEIELTIPFVPKRIPFNEPTVSEFVVSPAVKVWSALKIFAV
jgi:hypothetical protein